MSRPWMVVTLLVVTLLNTEVLAIDRRDDHDIYEDESYLYPGWLCDDCRDPAEYPGDFSAFAYNAYFGDDPWAFSSELGIPFRVYNLDLQWVVVWFEGFLFDVPSLLPNTMEIHVRLPTGEIVTFTVVQGGPDLPVGGAEPLPAPDGCDCGGGEEDAEDAEGFEGVAEFEDYEAPDNDYNGVVEIIDPDENGELPSWDMEL